MKDKEEEDRGLELSKVKRKGAKKKKKAGGNQGEVKEIFEAEG